MQHVGKQARITMPGQKLDHVSLCSLAAIATEGRRKRIMGASQDKRKSRPFDAPGQTQESVVFTVS
jgi:hypothetical protein